MQAMTYRKTTEAVASLAPEQFRDTQHSGTEVSFTAALLVNKKATLPLAATLTNVVVGGKASDDIGLQSGGWTIAWQGGSGRTTDGTTWIEFKGR